MLNVNQITADLARMPDAALQKYAALHKDDPYIMALALSESTRRKEMRAGAQMGAQQQPKVVDQAIAQMGEPSAPQPQAQQQPQPQQQPGPQGSPMPESVGIGALPAQNMQHFDDGGIVGYANGGMGPNPASGPAGRLAYENEPVLKMAAGGMVAFNRGGEVLRYNGQATYGSLVRSEADRLGLDPDTMMRLFNTESSWNPRAVSPRGAKYGAGIGQLSIDAAADMGLSDEDRYIPEKAIPAAMGYYKRQLDKFGSPDKALAAYNWGPRNLEKHLAQTGGNIDRVGLPKETANYLTKILPMGSAQAADTKQAATPADAALRIPGQTAVAPAKQTEDGFLSSDSFQRGAESLGLSRDVGRNIYNTLMAPTPLAPASTIPKAGPGLYGRAAALGERVYDKLFPGAGLSKEGIAALRTESELARKATPEAQLLLTGPQAKLPGTNIPVTQAGQGITDLVAPARMVPPGPDATRLEQMAAAANARKAAQAAQGAEAGATATKAGTFAQEASSIPSAAEKIQAASMAREAEHAAQVASAAQRGQAAKTGVSLASAAAGAADAFGPDAVGATGAGPDYETGFEDYVKHMPKDEKAELKAVGKEAVKEAGGKTKGFTDYDLMALGFGIMSGTSPFALSNIGEGGLKGLAMRQARIKEEADTAYKEAMAKHYGVDPFVQRLEALKDPKNMAMYRQMKEVEREPVTKEALWKQFSSSPMALAMDPKDLPAAFQRYVQSYEASLGPIGGLPAGVRVTPRGP